MSRFIVRNYGPSRQIPYEDDQICLSNDQCIETDDDEMAAVLGKEELMHVTDRGVEASSETPEELAKRKERKVTIDDPEAVHAERFPDEDEPENPNEDQYSENDEDDPERDGSDEISYEEMTVPELRELAEDRQIKLPEGYVRRADLIKALESYDIKALENYGN